LVFTEAFDVEETPAEDEEILDANADSDLDSCDSQSLAQSDEGNQKSGRLGSFRHRPTRGVGTGTSWDDRKPPTELQALDALPELDKVLKPQYEKNKKQKRYK